MFFFSGKIEQGLVIISKGSFLKNLFKLASFLFFLIFLKDQETTITKWYLKKGIAIVKIWNELIIQPLIIFPLRGIPFFSSPLLSSIHKSVDFTTEECGRFSSAFPVTKKLGLRTWNESQQANKIIYIINSGVGWVNDEELFTRLGKRGERKQSNNNGMRIRR